MPYLKIKSLKIFYDQKGDSEKAIIFLHGNSLSSNLFKYQFEDKNLLNKYNLVRFDFPGFGNSEHDKDQKIYSFPDFAKVFTELYNQLGIKKSILVGNSMGGHVLLETLENLSGVKGIIINGAPPVTIPPSADAFLPNPVIPVFYKGNYTSEELDLIAKAMVSNPEFEKDVKAELEKADPDFMKPWLTNMQVKPPKDEIEIVKNTDIPVAVIHGENDSFVNLNYLKSVLYKNLWKGKVLEVQNVGHLPFLENAKEFNKYLVEFCDQQFCR